MTSPHKYASTFETLTELRTELRSAQPVPPSRAPSLDEVWGEISPLPRSGLLVGMAEDGLPVILNLLDPAPGPLLVVGDPQSGKTRLLQVISQSIGRMSSTSEVSYITLTDTPAEWTGLRSQNCRGIHGLGSADGTRELEALIQAACRNAADPQIVAVLVDNLEAFVAVDELRQYLRWLLLSGPSHRVWPFVSLSTAKSAGLSAWLGEFQTRLFGCIQDRRMAANLSGDTEGLVIPRLVPGSQFAMRDRSGWLPFWIPRVD